MNSHQLLDLLQKLRQRFNDPSDKASVEGWLKSAEKAIIVEHLAQHEGMQELLGRMGKEVSDIDAVLGEADSATLPDKERDRLIDRRNLYRLFLEYFHNAGKTIKVIEQNIQDNIRWTE